MSSPAPCLGVYCDHWLSSLGDKVKRRVFRSQRRPDSSAEGLCNLGKVQGHRLDGEAPAGTYRKVAQPDIFQFVFEKLFDLAPGGSRKVDCLQKRGYTNIDTAAGHFVEVLVRELDRGQRRGLLGSEHVTGPLQSL